MAKFPITRQQASALILIIIALPIFAYAFLGVNIPQTYLPRSADVQMACNDGTPVTFSIIVNFSAVGCFSAENPIHVHIRIINANVSDLTSHIGGITFSLAFDINPQSIPSNAIIFGYLTLKQGDNNEYVADGDLIWHQSETSYLIPLPPFQGLIKSTDLSKMRVGEPFLYVSSVSDTLSFRSSHIMEQLTYVLIGFSVIMLQPILSALFPPQKAVEKPIKESNHRGPQKGRH